VPDDVRHLAFHAARVKSELIAARLKRDLKGIPRTPPEYRGVP
jgi:hypothetical protein